LHRADAGAAADPVFDEVAAGRHAGALGRAVRGDLGIRPLFLRLSERLLGVQSAGLAIALRLRGMVCARRCAAHVAYCGFAGDDVDLDRLYRGGVLRDADLVRAAAVAFDAEAARAVDVSDRQDRPRRAALHAFPGAGRAHRALPAARLAGSEVAL